MRMNGLGPLVVQSWRLWSFRLGVVSIRDWDPRQASGNRPKPRTLHMEPAHPQDPCTKKLFDLQIQFSMGTGEGGRGGIPRHPKWGCFPNPV